MDTLNIYGVQGVHIFDERGAGLQTTGISKKRGRCAHCFLCQVINHAQSVITMSYEYKIMGSITTKSK